MKLPYVKRPCKHCPFRKDTLKGWLGKSRMTCILKDESFVCHKNNNLQCAGHMLIKGEDNAFVRLARNMGIKLELAGSELVFTSEMGCIQHHSDEKHIK